MMLPFDHFYVERAAAIIRTRRKRVFRARTYGNTRAPIQAWLAEADTTQRELGDYLARYGRTLDEMDLAREYLTERPAVNESSST